MSKPLIPSATQAMKPMKEVLYIVVHCSATKVTQPYTAADIDRDHRARNWAMIGYHWVVERDGSITPGRPEQYAGAHVRHYNEHAIGVCYIGGRDARGRNADTRTPRQKASLHYLLRVLRESYPQARIQGHRDFPDVAKDCPCFDAITEYADLQPSNSSES